MTRPIGGFNSFLEAQEVLAIRVTLNLEIVDVDTENKQSRKRPRESEQGESNQTHNEAPAQAMVPKPFRHFNSISKAHKTEEKVAQIEERLKNLQAKPNLAPKSDRRLNKRKRIDPPAEILQPPSPNPTQAQAPTLPPLTQAQDPNSTASSTTKPVFHKEDLQNLSSSYVDKRVELSYNRGVKFLEEGDLINAALKFAQVPMDNKLFDEALQHIAEIMQKNKPNTYTFSS